MNQSAAEKSEAARLNRQYLFRYNPEKFKTPKRERAAAARLRKAKRSLPAGFKVKDLDKPYMTLFARERYFNGLGFMRASLQEFLDAAKAYCRVCGWRWRRPAWARKGKEK